MSKATGLLLIAAGVSAAAYMMPSETDEATQQAQVQPQEVFIVKAPAAATMTAVAATKEIIPPVPKPAVRPVKGENKVDLNKPTVVTVAARDRDERPVVRKAPVNAAILPGDRIGLTRELQRQLKRVGCYHGDINGMWTPASRRAMKAFTERVNATLPVDAPDYILLTLVESRQQRACGAPCPDGQVMAEGDRCLPHAVMAHAARKPAGPAGVVAKSKAADKPATVTSGWSTTTTTAATEGTLLPLTPEGRMSLAGPRKDDPSAKLADREDDASPAGAAETKAAKSKRSAERGSNTERRRKPVVENRSQRYVSAPRRKFGTWYFSERYIWND